jgi:hypothetical protein
MRAARWSHNEERDTHILLNGDRKLLEVLLRRTFPTA